MAHSPSRFLVASDAPPTVTRLREHVIYKNWFITVYDDDVQFTDGHTGTYGRIVQARGLPSAVMLPISGGHVALVRVYRYPVGRWEWELPRGMAHGADPEVTAREELLEELGAAPDSLICIGQITPDAGILTTVAYLFAASYSHMPATPRDTAEVAEVRWVTLAELQAAIRDGEVTDGLTLATVGAAACQELAL